MVDPRFAVGGGDGDRDGLRLYWRRVEASNFAEDGSVIYMRR